MENAIALSTNGGPLQVTKQGDLEAFGSVPFDQDSLTNILSLGMIAKKYHVVMDSVVENAFTIFTEHGPVKFACNKNQLYAHVPTKLPKYDARATDSGVQPSKK